MFLEFFGIFLKKMLKWQELRKNKKADKDRDVSPHRTSATQPPYCPYSHRLSFMPTPRGCEPSRFCGNVGLLALCPRVSPGLPLSAYFNYITCEAARQGCGKMHKYS